jgi:hypothetical protein
MADFKNSYEQKHWEFVVSTHSRMKQRLITFSNNKAIVDWAEKKIEELEIKYPQLKK